MGCGVEFRDYGLIGGIVGRRKGNGPSGDCLGGCAWLLDGIGRRSAAAQRGYRADNSRHVARQEEMA